MDAFSSPEPSRGKRETRQHVTLIIVAICFIGFLVLPIYLFLVLPFRAIDEREVKLCYHADHKGILAACRFLLQHPEIADFSGRPRDNPRLPLKLRELQPNWIRVDPDQV